MKLTKETLKRIIKEEIKAVLNEEKIEALDRTDASAVSAAARMIQKAERRPAIELDAIKKALRRGAKKLAIRADSDNPRDNVDIDLMKYVTYSN